MKLLKLSAVAVSAALGFVACGDDNGLNGLTPVETSSSSEALGGEVSSSSSDAL